MAQSIRRGVKEMSNYVSLKSVAYCAYFFETNNVFPIDKRNRICFRINEGVHLADVDSEWVKRLSKDRQKTNSERFKKI